MDARKFNFENLEHGLAQIRASGANVVGIVLNRVRRRKTGPVYGYYRCDFDETRDSHHVIQHKVVFDNLDSLRGKLQEIYDGRAVTIDTKGLPSGEWGQPWLTSYLSYLRRAKP